MPILKHAASKRDAINRRDLDYVVNIIEQSYQTVL